MQDTISAIAYSDANRLDSYFNRFLSLLKDNQLTLVSSILFALTSYYLLLASIKGNWTYGSRSACFTFYALTPNETQLNSFLFNALLLNLFSTAILYFTCQQLYLLVSDTYIY